MTTHSPFEHIESLCIGVVEFVSPDEVKVSLNIEAPESMALNTGAPRPFPRINGYVLIPVDEGYLVGQIEWIAIEKSPYPKRKGTQKDFGLVDLPYPVRKMSLNPVGVLSTHSTQKEFRFNRGVNSFPSVGNNVFLPTQAQLYAIIESGEEKQVTIGVSPLADGAKVRVNPDRLFGRHLAVLGNTGSGKSCSVAGIIRWSLEEATKQAESQKPNARFIVLDPNGEYSRAFSENENNTSIKARLFKVEHDEDDMRLQVPIWFWNSAEWGAFVQASAKTQRPTLIHALRNVRDGNLEPSISKSHEMRCFLRTVIKVISVEQKSGSPWGGYPKPKSFFEKLKKWQEGGFINDDSFSQDEQKTIEELNHHIEPLLTARSGKHPSYDFTKKEIDDLLSKVRSTHSVFGGSDSDVLPMDPDIPREFTGESFLRSIEASAEILGISEHVETMLIRIRTLLCDTRMKAIMEDGENITLENWLGDYIGKDEADENITIIDLSLVPTEVIHIITAVIARIIFEALQRYRKLDNQKKTLPTVMVMEEAHTFIKYYNEDAENQNAASVCCQVFERIAREGRKFGLGLVVSSQRPSELSPTVLSQCNTFLLHRISNDRDQDLIKRFIPDNLKGLLRELPSLPSQNAILMGWASELPVLVKINNLPADQRPQSEDPDFWNVWTKKETRKVDWKKVANDWQGKTGSESQLNSNENNDDEQNPNCN